MVERAARSVVVHRFALLNFAEGRGRFAVEATKGTYVRSLIDNLGKALGCGAHLSELRRTRAGRFVLNEALSLDELLNMTPTPILDPAEAVSHLPRFEVGSEWVAAVADGKRLPWELLSDEPAPSEVFALLTPGGKALLAIVEVEEEKLRYRRVFNYGLTSELLSSNVPAEIV